MAFRTRKRGARKYTRRARRYRGYKKRSSLIRRAPLEGMPTVHYARLRYCEETHLNPGAGLVSVYVMKANGLYDPNSTGVGHQPLGFDQMCTFYKRFIVLGSKITVTFTPVGTTNQNLCYCGVMTSTTGTDIAGMGSITEILENKKRGNVKMFGGYFLTANGPRQTVKKTFSLKKFIGARPGSEDVYSGTDAADPTNTIYYEIFNASVGANDPGDNSFLIQIDYYVKFFEPKNIAAS